MHKTPYNALAALVVLCLLAALGCGQFFPSSNTITAISVLPANASVAPGVTQQFTATGTYGNNSTADVTSQVAWSISPTTIATISSGGLVTGVTLGVANIKATSGNVIGTTSVTVANKTISSIAIQPLTLTLSASGTGFPTTGGFTATATYSDNTTGDVTNTSTWNALPSSVATISSKGVATAVTQGTATVTATASGITSNSATLTVVQ